MYTSKDCVRTMYDTVVKSNVGCIGILKPDALKEEYRQKKFQLFIICDGFGAYPDKMGNAVYGQFCADGEYCRMERYQFIGVANDTITEYAKRMVEKW